jgi:hypothetical protein
MRSRHRKAAEIARESKPAVWCGICHIRVAPFALTVRVIGNQVFHESCLEKGRSTLRQTDKVSQSQNLID